MKTNGKRSATTEELTKRLPTPWRKAATDIYIVAGDNCRVCTLNSGFGAGVMLANAQFIVTAVNSFEAMREALKEAKRVIESEHTAFQDEIRETAIDALTTINSAVALSERGGV